MSSPIRPATASGCGKVLGSKMIEPSRRTQVSCGAPRLVTIGGRSTMVEGSAGDAPADDSAGLSAPGGAPARDASNAAPAKAAKMTTTANSISDAFSEFPAAAPCGKAESDISAPASGPLHLV